MLVISLHWVWQWS